MATERETKEALTLEESLEKGFFGVVNNALPNSFHRFDNEAARAEEFGTNPAAAEPQPGASTGQTAKGAVINAKPEDSPKPTGGTSGPGATTDTSKDDKAKTS